MFKIGFTSVTFRNLSRREVCKLANENGIEIIEWGGDVHLPPTDKEALSEVLALQKEFNVKAASYGSYYRLGEKDYELWQHIVDTASAIGAKYIRIWQGSVGSKYVTPELFEDMVNETKKLAEIAKEKDLTVAFEYHKKTNNDTAKSSNRFLKAVNMDNVKTYWQPFSYWNDENTLKALTDDIVTIHVFTWDKACNRFDLKDGEEQWKKYIEDVKAAGIEPNFIMEFVKDDSPEQFKKDLAVLRDWLR